MVRPLSFVAWFSVILLFSAVSSGASSYTFYLEPDGGALELEIKQPAISLERIYVSLPEQRKRSVMRIDGIEPDVDWVYDYFRINTTGLKSEPGPVVFDIRVSKTWVDLGIDLQTITLSVQEGDWVEVPMTPVSEDSEFLNYRAYPEKLTGLYAVTGELVPVVINVNSPCNGNDVCEPGIGEERENCPDCIVLQVSRCVPSEIYCIDDNLFTCSEDGSDYILEECAIGCANGECMSTAGAPAGMAVALNPIFISVTAVLLTVLLYLTLLLKRMRSELIRIEKRKPFHDHEHMKKLVRK